MLSKHQGWIVYRAAIYVFVFALGVAVATGWYHWSFSQELQERDAKSCEQARIGRDTSRINAATDNLSYSLSSAAWGAAARRVELQEKHTQAGGFYRAASAAFAQIDKAVLVRLRCIDGSVTPIPGTAGRLQPDEVKQLPVIPNAK